MMNRVTLFLFALIALGTAAKVEVTFKILATSNSNEKSADQAAYDLKGLLNTNTLNSPHQVVNWTVHSDWVPGSTSTGSGATGGASTGASSEDNASGALKPLSLVLAVFISLFISSNKISRTIFGIAIACLMLNSQIFVSALTGYQNCKILDVDTNYKLYWSVTGNTIQFGMQATAAGYLALGFSQDGTMNSGGSVPGSDIYMGYVKAGECANGCVNDYSTSSYSLPTLDAVQNVQYIGGSSVGGVLTFEWSRQLNTGDNTYDNQIPLNQDVHVLWSMQTTTVPLANDSFIKHDRRSPVLINFSTASVCPGDPNDILVEMLLNTSMANYDQNTLVSNMATQLGISSSRIVVLSAEEIQDPYNCPGCGNLDFRYNNYAIPPQVTTYVCLGFSFSQSTSSQIIRMEALEDNNLVLHHMVLYLLPEGSGPYSSTPTDCNMPAGASIMYVWAPGGQPLDLPSDVGISVGGSTNIWYAVLNMHYTNPTSQTGYVDSSGVRLWLSPSPRTYEAGYLFTGVNTNAISIPPKLPNLHFANVCPPSLTGGLTAPMKVIAAMPHMHQLGKSLWTEQFRNGSLVGYIAYVPNYDYNDQKNYMMNNVSILPGDELITHCIYNSMKQNTTTNGGEGTFDEMCYNIILYYPKVDSGFCILNNLLPCNCSVSQNCTFRPECSIVQGSCSKYSTCSSCGSASEGCSWCASPFFTGCTSNLKRPYCALMGGVANNCTVSGTPCAAHNDCTTCNNDDVNRCGWCKSNLNNESFCQGYPVGQGQYSGAVCNAVGYDNYYSPNTC